MSYNIRHKPENQGNSASFLILVLVFFAVVLLLSAIKQGLNYANRRQIAKEQEELLAKERQNQAKLQLRLKKSQTEEFVETEARRLSLSKKDEYIVLASFPTPTPASPPPKVKTVPNYKLWWNVFFSQK